MATTVENNKSAPAQKVMAAGALDVRIRKAFAGDFELNVAFALRRGITILFGASGAGKTTLLDCIAGLTLPDSGRVATSDRVLFDSERRINIPVKSRNVGYVFQDLALFPHLNVESNVAYGLAGIHPQEREQVVHCQARGNAPPLAIQNNFNCLCFRDFHPASLTLPFAPHYI